MNIIFGNKKVKEPEYLQQVGDVIMVPASDICENSYWLVIEKSNGAYGYVNLSNFRISGDYGTLTELHECNQRDVKVGAELHLYKL